MTTTDKRAVKPAKKRLIKTDEAADFVSGDALTWGKRAKKVKLANGDWTIEKMVPIWIARFLLTEGGQEHIHWYCLSPEVARSLYWEAIYTLRTDLIKRIGDCVSWSYGLQEDWMNNPVVFLNQEGQDKQIKPFPFILPYDYEDDEGNTSDFRGPYGLTFAPPEEPGQYIWLQGRRVRVDAVPDLMIDTTLDEDTLTYVEKQFMLHDRRMYRQAVEAGELPAFTE
jgi:hypothetical protein